ncbi:pantoate--beta-alanine ligase [Crocinitomicaceae bacterium]|nr:pantoate--beta-alanine ligase [Crocinitomicaceae bacterium]MDB3906790.1 pantoate--beta-alanine ligase [Crocinitomicaceae bacterium]
MAKTQVFTTVASLQNHLSEVAKKSTVGFVPTMGALHSGHVSLVKASSKQCDFTVVSIFVNPTQFNNSSDLEKYPRDFDKDISLLEASGGAIVFAPTVDEMYPEGHQPKRMELGRVANIMEGEFRPGHFDGVVEVVYRFLEIVNPTHTYFGEKDLQQLSIVRHMVKEFNLPVEVVGCETHRLEGGLAASSRNERLTKDQKEKALILYQSLDRVRAEKESYGPREAREKIKEWFQDSELELEYIEFVDATTFEDVTEWTVHTHGCIAAFAGQVRLLDNISMV